MSALKEAKSKLSLPDLMTRLGLKDHAKRSAKCPFHEDQNNSFSVYQRAGEWFWKCHAGCGGGDAAELVARVEGLNNAQACRRLIELASTSPRSAERRHPITRADPASVSVESFPAMPDDVRHAWSEGIDYLLAHPTAAVRLAAFRGWPVAFAQHLIDCGAISMPNAHKDRGFAFQVVAPEGEPGSMTTRPIGYHVRVSKEDGWRYAPCENSHGQSIPALPYLVGDFDKARLLIITEGQWDALTFAFAAGWIGDDGCWPAGLGVIGIRGASGVGTFLRHYRRFWPAGSNCLVLADADPAGRSWYEGEHSFARQLGHLCAKVSVVDCGDHKDFNDLYRAEKPTKSDIGALLKSHGYPESEVLS